MDTCTTLPCKHNDGKTHDLRKVRSAPELTALEKPWRALWDACPSATPFQSPDWLLPWTQHLLEGELLAFAIFYGKELVALAPFFVYEEPTSGARKLMLLGSGNSDYLDVLIRPGNEDAALAAVGEALAGTASEWDVLDLQQLRPDSPLRRARLPFVETAAGVQDVCLLMSLARRAFAGSVPSAMVKAYRYARRRAERDFYFDLRIADAVNFDELFDALVQLHESRWSARGEDGVLAESSLQKFHRNAARQFLQRGMLRLYVLELDSTPVAAYYGFHSGDCAYYYLGGFHPDFSRYSPGTIIVGHAIEQASKSGAAAFDFLRGQEAYKYKWGAEERPNYTRKFTSSFREDL